MVDRIVKPSKDLIDFWNDIYWLSYMSGVMNYKDNGFDKILEKYGLHRMCPECHQPILKKP